MMNKNVKIAKQLVKLAKTLVAEENIASSVGKYEDFTGDIRLGRTSGKVENATFELRSGGEVWWENGVWIDGTWQGGVWHNGTWKDGTWEYGAWEHGIWENGTWKGGTRYNGTWKGGIWENGEWWWNKNNKWEGGTWKKGKRIEGRGWYGEDAITYDSPDKWEGKPDPHRGRSFDLPHVYDYDSTPENVGI